MRKILVCTADRAERGLLNPIIEELQKLETIKTEVLDLSQYKGTYMRIFGESYYPEELDFAKYDIVLIPCDRNEMVYFAAKAFHSGTIVAHFHAGNLTANHPDDFNRRAISLYSHIMLCNWQEHKDHLIMQGEDESRIFVVGSTAFDNIKPDYMLLPCGTFDVVVLHPNPISKKETEKDLATAILALNTTTSDEVIWIYPNKDKNSEIITNYLDKLPDNFLITKYSNLPRAQYLGLLEECEKVIGNSSSFYYELPFIDDKKQIIHIGNRNKDLVVPKNIQTGGAKKIASLLATIELTENLRNKKCLT